MYPDSSELLDCLDFRHILRLGKEEDSYYDRELIKDRFEATEKRECERALLISYLRLNPNTAMPLQETSSPNDDSNQPATSTPTETRLVERL